MQSWCAVAENTPHRNQCRNWTGLGCHTPKPHCDFKISPPVATFRLQRRSVRVVSVLFRGQAVSPESLVLNQCLDFIHKIPGKFQDLFRTVSFSHFIEELDDVCEVHVVL